MNYSLSTNNLFTYATSELSQDAFLCWLLSHAMEENWNIDAQLRECAIVWIRKFYPMKANERVTEITRQYKNIDILVKIGDVHIIIEDKTFTNSHDGQINRYRKTLIDKKVPADKVICVYYKIIEQFAAEKDVDFEFTRKTALEVMSPYKEFTDNRIFLDYVDYLEYIDIKTNSYKVLPIKDWSSEAYRGFFTDIISNGIIDIDKDNSCSGWGSVSNPRGGFWGLWWNYLTNDELNQMGLTEAIIDELYLQIEKDTITVKMSLRNDQDYNETVVSALRYQIFEYFSNYTGKGLSKKTSRIGRHMTIGYLPYNETNYKEKLHLMHQAMKSMVQDFQFTAKSVL